MSTLTIEPWLRCVARQIGALYTCPILAFGNTDLSVSSSTAGTQVLIYMQQKEAGVSESASAIALKAIHITRMICSDHEVLLALHPRLKAEAPVFLTETRPILHPQATLSRVLVHHHRGSYYTGATQDHAVTWLSSRYAWRKSILSDAGILDLVSAEFIGPPPHARFCDYQRSTAYIGEVKKAGLEGQAQGARQLSCAHSVHLRATG
jgi:hypothetical protein